MDTARLLKSKVSIVFDDFPSYYFFVLLIDFQGINRTAGTIKMCVNISTSTLLI